MSNALRMSTRQARLLHLHAQGLLASPRRRARKADVVDAIERMRLLQIDTIHVVARSPYLVLFSRLGAYRSEWLDAALADGAIVECWAHEASFAPARDIALHRRHALEREGHWAMKHAHRMRREQRPAMDALLAHIRANGPVRTSDFERSATGPKSGWWGWKDEKRWLEALFALGELMITRRENFQRVYDLGERVLAKSPRVADVDAETMRREFALGAVRALGLTRARWINDYFRSGGRIKDAALDAFVDDGTLSRVDVDGWDAPGYVHRDHHDALVLASKGRLRATHTTLLSPFDPVVWDRERARGLFDFDYRIECYVPEPKRIWGYYVLPILHRGALIGRCDAKAHRADGVFEVKALYLEEGVAPDESLANDIAAAIAGCAAWHATPNVVIGKCAPRAFKKPLQSALRMLES
jgi:uncharacterized protein YcaQ